MKENDEKQNVIIILALESYLRNWLEAGAFKELNERYNVTYAVVKYDWDPELIRSYGIKGFKILSQSKTRKNILQRLLIITMVKYVGLSKAFKIKIARLRGGSRAICWILALPVINDVICLIFRYLFPAWKELKELILDVKPDLIIMPSLCTDSWTVDMILTAKRMRVKSLVLINSWDNLVSKGVVPLAPDCLGVWGEQGVRQAMNVQKIPRGKIVILGVPRFESYFDGLSEADKEEICRYNFIPRGKKVILYASTSLPFDDLGALKTIDEEMSSPEYKDYVVLYRPHPEMINRVRERHFNTYNFKHVYLDKQVAPYYNGRFGEDGALKKSDFPSSINQTDLEYYPRLMRSIEAIICPPTTLSLEAALNKVPCLMICYHDGVNNYLPPSDIAQYGHIQDILVLPGIISCVKPGELLSCFKKLISYSNDERVKKRLFEATKTIVYRDEYTYGQRFSKTVEKVLT